MEKKQGQFLPTLTLASATYLVISSVIGTGVYKKVALMSGELHSPSLVLLCWFLGGMLTLCGALSNSEIASMYAGTGGEYIYFKRIYGRFIAFLFGWSNFTVIKTASISSIAYVFAQSFNSLITLPHFSAEIENITVLSIFKPFESIGIKLLTIIVILALTYLNTLGLKNGESLSRRLTQMVIVGIGLIVLAGFLFGGGEVAHLTTPAKGFVPSSVTNFGLMKMIFAGLLATFWAYEGWNTVGYIGGEIKNPSKNLPLALFFGLITIITVYMLANAMYLYVLPVDDLINVNNAQNKIAAVEVVRHFGGAIGASLLSVLILFTTLGCTNATILMPPRIYQTMAQDGIFFEKAKEIHPVYNTPTPALWMQGGWASILVLSGNFDQLTEMLIFVAFFFYGATTLGVFILRVREPNTPRPYKVWGYPFVPAIFVLFCATLIPITIINSPREAGLGLLLMFSGVPFYLYWRMKMRTGK